MESTECKKRFFCYGGKTVNFFITLNSKLVSFLGARTTLCSEKNKKQNSKIKSGARNLIFGTKVLLNTVMR